MDLRYVCCLVALGLVRGVAAGVPAHAGSSVVDSSTPTDQSTDSESPRVRLHGRTIDATSGLAIPGAGITVIVASDPHPPLVAQLLNRTGATGGTRPSRDATTDEAGRFTVPVERRARSMVRATATGYLPAAFGQMWPGAPEGLLDASGISSSSEITIALWKYASISGTVFREDGKPGQGIAVYAAPYSSVQPTAGALPLIGQPTGMTDSNGHYTLTQLPPGKYVIAVVATYTTAAKVRTGGPVTKETPQGGDTPDVTVGGSVLRGPSGLSPIREGQRIAVYQTAFYPGDTPVAGDASIIRLGGGDAKDLVDFHLQPSTALSISGTVHDGSDPVSNASLNLFVRSADAIQSVAFPVATTSSDSRGHFDLFGIPAGRYELVATKRDMSGIAPPLTSVVTTTMRDGVRVERGVVRPTTPPKAGDLTAATALVDVDRSPIIELDINLTVGPRVVGRVTFEPKTETGPNFDQLDVWLSPTLKRSGPIRLLVAADGRLASEALLPGSYVVSINARGGWMPLSVDCGGMDGTHVPLRLTSGDCDFSVTLTRQAPALTVDVSGSDTAPRQARVFIFPASVQDWLSPASQVTRMRMFDVKSAGYTARLVPGDYLVAAVNAATFDSDWRDADVLGVLAGIATRVALKQGDAKALRLNPVTLQVH